LSISETVVLPDQPAAGSVEYVGLGGNGYLAPHSMYLIDQQITGDVTGGDVLFRISRDERFEHLIMTMMVQGDGSTVDLPFRMEIFRGQQSFLIQSGLIVATTVLNGTGSNRVWSPSPLIGPTFWRLRVDNTLGKIVKFKSVIYNFRIDASKLVPLNLLLQNLPRAASAL